MTMFNDEYYMKMALQQAQHALERDEVPVGCIIVAGNQVIAKAHNLTETLNDVTAHAEMQAITAAADFLGGKYLQKCTLYVTLEPCVMCSGALAWSQISRVVIGARDERRGFVTNGLSLHPKTEVTWDVMDEECSAVVKAFFRQKR